MCSTFMFGLVQKVNTLERKASFTGTSISTKGTVTNVTGATLSGPLITGVSWQKKSFNFQWWKIGCWAGNI